MIRQLICVAILVSRELHMVLVSLIHRRTETHSNGLKFKTLFSLSLALLFPVLCSGALAPPLPLPPVPTPHSPCLWDTPFIYFFIKLQRSLRLISCGSWWNGEHAGSFPKDWQGLRQMPEDKNWLLVQVGEGGMAHLSESALSLHIGRIPLKH